MLSATGWVWWPGGDPGVADLIPSTNHKYRAIPRARPSGTECGATDAVVNEIECMQESRHRSSLET
jgi:hypothetical protein